MSEAIVVYDVDDRLVLCNSRFKEFDHYGADDVLLSVLYGSLARLDLQRDIVLADETDRYIRGSVFRVWLLAARGITAARSANGPMLLIIGGSLATNCDANCP